MTFRKGSRQSEQDGDGNEVFPCLWIGCDKVFGTAGHVRRHEKTHAGSTPYDCPHCDKSFGRSDVRAKHVATMHPGEGDMSSTASGTPPSKIRRMSTVSRFGEDPPSQSMSQTNRNSFHPLGGGHQQPPLDLSWSQQVTVPNISLPSSDPPSLYVSPTAITMSGPSTADVMLTNPTSAFDLSHNGFLDPNTLSTGPSTLPLGPDPVLSGNGTGDLFDPFSTNWELFGQVFGWGLDSDIDLDLGISNNTLHNASVGPVTSTENLSAAWLLAATPRHGSPVDGEPEAAKDPFGRSHDSPWPELFKPKNPDRPLTLGGVKASPKPGRIPSGKEVVSQTSRNAMLSLIYLSHQMHWQMPNIEDFPDHVTMSDFIDLYFEKFHPTFPIIHKPSFYKDDIPAILLLSVAAIGATYADKEFRPLAVATAELVRRIITWLRASDQRAKFDRPTLTAYLLYTILSVACGSREMFLHAEISRGSLVTMRRRLNVLRPGRSSMDELLAQNPEASVQDKWQAYIEDEGKRRFGWGIYVMDAQFSALLNLPPISSISEAGVPFPADDHLWDAPDANVWAKRQAATPTVPKPAFPEILARSLTQPTAGLDINDFGCSALAYTLYRLQYEEYLTRRALAPHADAKTLTMLLPGEQRAQQALLALSKTCLDLDTPSHLRLSAVALYHHSVIHLSYPGLMEHIRVASGKFEPDMTKEASTAWLRQWALNAKDVRRVMWHAGVLNALLGEFAKGEFAEFYWTFDCALALWAIVKFGAEVIKVQGLRSALFAANWFDTDAPAMWLEHGGQIVFPILGSSSTLTVDHILQLFMARLNTSPWGLAEQFKQVLIKLMEAEK